MCNGWMNRFGWTWLLSLCASVCIFRGVIFHSLRAHSLFVATACDSSSVHQNTIEMGKLFSVCFPFSAREAMSEEWAKKKCWIHGLICAKKWRESLKCIRSFVFRKMHAANARTRFISEHENVCANLIFRTIIHTFYEIVCKITLHSSFHSWCKSDSSHSHILSNYISFTWFHSRSVLHSVKRLPHSANSLFHSFEFSNSLVHFFQSIRSSHSLCWSMAFFFALSFTPISLPRE